MTKSLAIIVGSTRTNRLGRSVAEWASELASQHGYDNVELLDLKEINLPAFDAPVPPMYAPNESAPIKAWAAQIEAAERLVVLTPEYNQSIPASLKGAIDYLSAEWHNKPSAIVSYGYMGGGANAAKHLREILTFVKTDLIEETAAIQLGEETTAEGTFHGDKTTEAEQASLVAVLATLADK